MSAATRVTFANNKLIDPLLDDFKWAGSNGMVAITYSFPEAGAWWQAFYGSEVNNWSGLNAAQQSDFEKALATWAEVANISFVEVAESNRSVGDIRVAFSRAVSNDGSYAWTYLPDSKIIAPYVGDVWLNSDDKFADFGVGSDNYETFVHEIGHALGLSHPFNDNSGASLLPVAVENYKYTVMSYTEYAGAGYYPDIPEIIGVAPSTPMLLDIQAIQYLYGANMNTRIGDDVYAFSNAGPEFKTIWDAGGIDTFDLSNQTLNAVINLQPGGFSSIGKTYNKAEWPVAARENIAIAYNVTIENAIGGSGKDTLTGNTAANYLSGGNGNDVINGLDGDDVLMGGGGNDRLTGGLGNDLFNVTDKSKDVFADFSAANDTIQLENSVFTQFTTTGGIAAGNFKVGPVAGDADDYLVYNSINRVLSYDEDGNGAVAPVPIAVVGVALSANLTSADFVVI